ncbi:MAG: glycoside hydrolase family 43 protein [Ferruginibacter sp.]
MFINTVSGQTFSASDSSIYLADPAIFNFKGTYYLFGTVEENANNGFVAYTSTDLVKWKKPGQNNNSFALSKGNVFGNAKFWAPQVFLNGNSITMAYVADENIAVATSEFPVGPFMQNDKRPLAASVKQIDPFIFIDDDGKKYLYHVRLQDGNKIFVAEMEPDLSAVKPATLKECISATQSWENTTNAVWPVAEGPSVLKRGDTYFLFYTANDFRNPDYAVGYATSKSPYGPWIKYEGNPIISKKNIGVNGTGHGDFFTDSNNELHYVFHTHFSENKVWPRRTAMVNARFSLNLKSDQPTIEIDSKSFHYLFISKD